MEILLRKISKYLSFFYPEKLLEYLKIIHRYVYSEKIKRRFYKHGNIVSIRYPIDLKGAEYIEIGEEFRTNPGLILHCWDKYGNIDYSPRIKIGNNANLGRNNHIGCINCIEIGDNLLTGSNVFITDHNHGEITSDELGVAPIKRNLSSKGKVKIGFNVWLGDNVVVLANVEIGDNVVVGANSVVTKNIESNCVAVGNPARVIKKL